MDFQKQAVAKMRKKMKLLKPYYWISRRTTVVLCILAILILSPGVHASPLSLDTPLIEVKGIQHQSASGNEKVIINLSDVAQFVTDKLSDPERLVIDFKHAMPGKELIKELRVANGFIKSVRTGRYDANTVRVVLDMTNNRYEEKLVVLHNSPGVLIDISPVKQDNKPEIGADFQKTGQGLSEKSTENLAAALIEKNDEQTLSLESGIRAETEGQWEKALGIYKSMLEKTPDRTDLWIRISDIEAQRGNAKAATEALQEAARLSKNDGSLYSRLSQNYAAANQPQPALDAIEKAVELDPANSSYLDARAKIGTWNGRYDIALDSYERLLKIAPENDTSLLQLARVSSWSGALNKSDGYYQRYLEKHPEDRDALIEWVKVKAWMGNYPVALDLLEKYRKDFGETDDFLREKARVLAWADRPQSASAILLPLLKTRPDDYELNYTNTIALYYAPKPSEVVESLNTLRKLRPEAKEMKDIEKFVMTPLRSNIQLGFHLYHDSDSLDIYHWYLSGAYAVKPETWLQARIDMHYLRADKGSGLENIDGDESTWHHSGRIGIMHRFSEKVAADGYFGGAFTEDDNNIIYGLGANFRPAEEFRFRLSREYGYYLESARTASLGIKRGANRLDVQWEPKLRYTILASLSYDTFSDDNERWEFMISPRRQVVRNEKLNLDIGVNIWRYGFDEDPNHGYYAPELYQRYAVTGLGYWKINDNNGLGLTGGIGIHKDDTMDGFRTTYDASFEGTFGIYSDWMLKMNGGLTHNLRRESGAFEAYAIGAYLTRRF